MSQNENNRNRHRHQASGWGSTKFINPQRIRRPSGLHGKQIGLFYRNLQVNKKNNNRTIQAIHLTIPKPVYTKLISNLEYISQLAAKSKIEIIPEKISAAFDVPEHSDYKIKIPDDEHAAACSSDMFKKDNVSENNLPVSIKEEVKSESEESTTEPNPKQIKLGQNYIHSAPSTSSGYIPVLSENSDCKIDQKIVNPKGAGDFKYGYNDITTGTFEEKLEESLAKGINITKTNSDVKSLNIAFYEERLNNMSKAHYKNMLEFREKLPAYKKANEILHVIHNNQVVIISGETGCGKSTQVPQIILDDALMRKKGANVKILVTQPRRIAAASLAMRVAQERAEKLGSSVGYAVRLEKVECRPRGSIMFCTTGILLVDLEINQCLSDYSHIILDEVHERDIHVDFAMCMLKQVLKKRKDLKLILMSATLDAQKLSSYFDDSPMMHIKGLAYPVKDVYLEEILHFTKFQLPETNNVQNDRHRPQRRFGRANNDGREQMQLGIKYRAEIAPWLESIKTNLDKQVYVTLQDHRIEDLHLDLVFETIKHICRGPPGAILVFLPGMAEITNLLKLLYENQAALGRKCEIHAIHSKLSTIDQHRIFEKPPGLIRKIIVATNIAETSITIDDIVYVVDCGKMKYNGLNVEQYLATLKTEWVSKANMHQRRGRAGRCQPGVCFHLLTSYRASTLEDRLLPELQRSDLLEPVLTIKRLRLGKASEALKSFPDPPEETTIARAVTHLQQCGALDENETLTPLGWHLARLPVHPAAGKLILFGALFGCLNRAASVAAVWSFKDPFNIALDKEFQLKEAKRSLALGEPSDHIAISEAIIQWEECEHRDRRTFAFTHFLSHNTLGLLADMKKQLGYNLQQMGFLNSGKITSPWENRNTGNLSLFKAIVAAALYPNISAAKWVNNPHKQMRVTPRLAEGPAQIHPSSIMAAPKERFNRSSRRVQLCLNPGANWMVYWLKQKSTDLFLLEVTLVYTLPLVFFGELKVSTTEDDPNSCYIYIATFKVRMLKETAKLLFQLRALLDQVLASKIMVGSQHAEKYSLFEEEVLNAAIEVITAEDERAEYLDGGTDSDTSECDSKG